MDSGFRLVVRACQVLQVLQALVCKQGSVARLGVILHQRWRLRCPSRPDPPDYDRRLGPPKPPSIQKAINITTGGSAPPAFWVSVCIHQ